MPEASLSVCRAAHQKLPFVRPPFPFTVPVFSSFLAFITLAHVGPLFTGGSSLFPLWQVLFSRGSILYLFFSSLLLGGRLPSFLSRYLVFHFHACLFPPSSFSDEVPLPVSCHSRESAASASLFYLISKNSVSSHFSPSVFRDHLPTCARQRSP